MIEVKNISKNFGTQKILDNVSFSLNSGEIIGISGRNGAGKSVLFKILCGLIYPDSGEVLYNGKKLHRGYFPESTGVVLDALGFIPYYTGFRNLKLLADVNGKIKDDVIRSYLDLVGLGDQKKKLVFQYSKGMKKRLALAQALMENPDILILDEPFDGIDYNGLLYFRDVLQQERDKGKSILMTSHNQEDLNVLTNRILLLQDGKLSLKK